MPWYVIKRRKDETGRGRNSIIAEHETEPPPEMYADPKFTVTQEPTPRQLKHWLRKY